MRLSQLIVHGFKSFADRTEFVFDAPVTCVVGPNGCGKSNVVDAVKWVLGEQSAKSLRGDAMADVIFNGSGDRKPGGMAEVTLVFDNPPSPDGTRRLGIDTDHVSVGRRLCRDGSSDYTLNGRVSRLRDVRDLFLDTGVGVDAYSVIEQGRVSRMLEASPAERRVIFEEAAGISKFKAQKKEALRKLERVDQNLLRVNDIAEEIDRRLRAVKVQAGRARTHNELAERLREARRTLALHEYHESCRAADEAARHQDDLKFRLDDAATELRRRQNAAAITRQQAEDVTRRLEESRHAKVEADAATQRARQDARHAADRVRQIEDQITTASSERQALTDRLAVLRSTIASDEASLGTLTDALDAARGTIREKEAAFRDGQSRANDLHRDIERRKGELLKGVREAATVESRLSSIEIERSALAGQQKRYAERRDVVYAEAEGVERRREELAAQVADADGLVRRLRDDHERERESAMSFGKQVTEWTERLGTLKEQRSGLQARQKLLEDLERRREGLAEGVKAAMKRREGDFQMIRGVVADLLTTDVENAQRLEVALDGREGWLVATSPVDLVEAAGRFSTLPGPVRVIPLTDCDAPAVETAPHPTAGSCRPAIDLLSPDPTEVQTRALAERLLGHTLVVPTLADAVRRATRSPGVWRYVTHDGQILERDGSFRLGPSAQAGGVVSRRSELARLAREFGELEADIAACSAEVARTSEAARETEKRVNDLRNAAHDASTRRVEIAGRLAAAGDKAQSLRREVPIIDRELAALDDRGASLTREAESLRQKATGLAEGQASTERQIVDLNDQQAALQRELSTLADALTTARVHVGQVQEQQLSRRQAVERGRSAAGEATRQLDRIAGILESAAARRVTAETDGVTAAEIERRSVAQSAELAASIERSSAEAESLKKAVREGSEAVEAVRARLADVDKASHEADLASQQIASKRDHLLARTADELSIDLPAAYAAAVDEHRVAGHLASYEPPPQDWPALAEQVRQLRDRLTRLGSVNLDAIGEQEELETRASFLIREVEDSRQAKAQLVELIETINRQSGERFATTFDAVREHFQGMFRKLFGGGKADVFLQTEVDVKGEDGRIRTTKVDVLDAGIEIVARPPGKQPVSISQLSGGEKTMTCVALLMSLFKSKPSPFCILDEVDAALDEANNERFNRIVQEFLGESQFIVITHSKATMRMADVLYGVTMQEPGVSKRVAVRFDQVDDDGRLRTEAA